jgi:ribosomal protein S18 acetylase RimI-like enzyme
MLRPGRWRFEADVSGPVVEKPVVAIVRGSISQAHAIRVPPHRRLAVCRFLTAGFPPTQHDIAATWLDERFESGEFDPLWLMAVDEGEVQAAAYFHVDGHGGAVMMGYRVANAKAERQLWTDAAIWLQEAGVVVLQAVTTPEKTLNYRGLPRCGFRGPYRLIEQRRELTADDAVATIDPAIRLEPYTDDQFDLFAKLLVETYVDSQDMPELNDVRTPAQAMGCHLKHAHEQSPFLYRIEVHREPVGVLFFNPAEPGKAWDLTYVGLRPPWRKRGIGQQIVKAAVAKSAQAGAPALVLTFDERNDAARRLYVSVGFRSCGSYDVYLRLFKS